MNLVAKGKNLIPTVPGLKDTHPNIQIKNRKNISEEPIIH